MFHIFETEKNISVISEQLKIQLKCEKIEIKNFH